MTRPLRALASLLVGIATVVGMIVYQHYSREPLTDVFTAAVTNGGHYTGMGGDESRMTGSIILGSRWER
jgi:ABC-type Fe3+-siderophore transport system permease subunit